MVSEVSNELAESMFQKGVKKEGSPDFKPRNSELDPNQLLKVEMMKSYDSEIPVFSVNNSNFIPEIFSVHDEVSMDSTTFVQPTRMKGELPPVAKLPLQKPPVTQRKAIELDVKGV